MLAQVRRAAKGALLQQQTHCLVQRQLLPRRVRPRVGGGVGPARKERSTQTLKAFAIKKPFQPLAWLSSPCRVAVQICGLARFEHLKNHQAFVLLTALPMQGRDISPDHMLLMAASCTGHCRVGQAVM